MTSHVHVKSLIPGEKACQHRGPVCGREDEGEHAEVDWKALVIEMDRALAHVEGHLEADMEEHGPEMVGLAGALASVARVRFAAGKALRATEESSK